MNKKKMIQTVIIVAIVAVIFLVGARESNVIVDEQTVKIGGIYGKEIPVGEVLSLQLSESMPAIERRTNGMGFLSIRKGFFRLEGVERARLLLHSLEGPYIFLQTEEELVILNFRHPDQTVSVFDRISAVVQ